MVEFNVLVVLSFWSALMDFFDDDHDDREVIFQW